MHNFQKEEAIKKCKSRDRVDQQKEFFETCFQNGKLKNVFSIFFWASFGDAKSAKIAALLEMLAEERRVTVEKDPY